MEISKSLMLSPVIEGGYEEVTFFSKSTGMSSSMLISLSDIPSMVLLSIVG